MTEEHPPTRPDFRDISLSAGSLSFSYPLAWLIGIGIIWYLIGYLSHPVLPGANQTWPLGWWGWWDQGCYWRSAQELAQFKLTRANYWYPLGYPLIGAVFFRLMPSHAFLIPDLLCFLGILILFNRICREFVSPWESVALGVAALLLPRTILINALVVPWNSTPAHLMIYCVIVLLAFCRPRPVNFVIAAFLAALMPWFRADGLICLVPVFAAHFWEDLRRGEIRKCVTKIVFSAVLVSLSVGMITAVNHTIFGEATTPYMQRVSTVGCSLKGVARKAYSIFVSASPMWHHAGPMLLQRFPYLLLVVPGIVYLLTRYSMKHLGWIGAIGASIGFYLAFNDFEAHNVFKYLLIHYWAWWIPLATLLAYLGLVKSWKVLKVWGVLISSLPCLLLVGVIQLKQESVLQSPPVNTVSALRAATGPEQKVRLILDERRPLPVSKLVIPELQPALKDYDRVVIILNGRVAERFRQYTMDVTERGTVFVFRRDVRRNESIVVEFDRMEGQDDKQLFHLEAYCLEFGVGGGGFWDKGVRWFDDLSLPNPPP